jgi:hypothetical protein
VLTPNWNPDRRTARQFAVIWLAFFLGLGLYRAWRGGAFDAGVPFGVQGAWTAPIVLWSLACAIGIPGIIAPRMVRPIYIGMMALTFPVGWIVSHALLAVVYFGLFTVMGLVFRLIKRDRLQMHFDRQAPTYWQDRTPASEPAQYFRLW